MTWTRAAGLLGQAGCRPSVTRPGRGDELHRRGAQGSDAGWGAAIDLIDGEALCALLRERELGVRVRQVVREEVAVLPAFFAEI